MSFWSRRTKGRVWEGIRGEGRERVRKREGMFKVMIHEEERLKKKGLIGFMRYKKLSRHLRRLNFKALKNFSKNYKAKGFKALKSYHN